MPQFEKNIHDSAFIERRKLEKILVTKLDMSLSRNKFSNQNVSINHLNSLWVFSNSSNKNTL